MKTLGALGAIAALILLAPLAGCGTTDLFGKYDLPESANVAEADWPRLIDVPSAPPAGEYNDAAPDPARGAEVIRELSSAAADARARAIDLGGLAPAETDREDSGSDPASANLR